MRSFALLIGVLPYAWLRFFGRALGTVVGSILRIRRKHAVEALRTAGIAEPPRVANEVYASLGTTVFELLWFSVRPPEAIDERVVMTPRAAERFARAASLERGVIVVAAHTGNWDLAACRGARWLARAGRGPLSVVTKRLSWASLDRTWQHLRASRGLALISPDGAVGRVVSTLAIGGSVAFMCDQAPERSSGVAALPFLGRVALHDLAPALLAARAGVPILVVSSWRRADLMHELDVLEVIEPGELANGAGVTQAAQKIARALEGFIRAHPEQWLWLHHRWKGLEETARRSNGGRHRTRYIGDGGGSDRV
jgi:KDO2-lipid IV(A) lauroyltransferase